MKLRTLTEDDLEMILEWRNAPEVRRNMYTSHLISLEEHRRWFQKVKADPGSRYFVYENEEEPCGVVAFTGIVQRHRRASWAFYASPRARRGTGSKMEYLALDHAFGEMRLHKLHCEVLSFNQLVIKLHRSFGFQIEGVLREHHRDGTNFHDVCQLAILAREWDGQRDAIRHKLRLDEERS